MKFKEIKVGQKFTHLFYNEGVFLIRGLVSFEKDDVNERFKKGDIGVLTKHEKYGDRTFIGDPESTFPFEYFEET